MGVPFRVNQVPNSPRWQIFLKDPNNVELELNFDIRNGARRKLTDLQSAELLSGRGPRGRGADCQIAGGLESAFAGLRHRTPQ